MSENKIRRFECIKEHISGTWLTKGKIYESINGRFIFDDGYEDNCGSGYLLEIGIEDGFTMGDYLFEIIEPIIHPLIKKVIFNPPYTICIFHDKSKQISKCDKEDEYDKMVGISICVAKHILGG